MVGHQAARWRRSFVPAPRRRGALRRLQAELGKTTRQESCPGLQRREGLGFDATVTKAHKFYINCSFVWMDGWMDGW